ncbi:MAG: hypothetical protein AAF125_04295 [Chloroflexota bacterium]
MVIFDGIDADRVDAEMDYDPSQIVYLIAKQRSGTHLFNGVIASAPDISPVGEVYHVKGAEDPINFFHFRHQWLQANPNKMIGDYHVHVEVFDAYHAFLVSKARNSRVLVDAKYNVLHNHNHAWQNPLEAPVIFNMLAERDIPVVHLIRRDLLDCYLSHELARADGEWVRREISTNVAHVPTPSTMLTLDPASTAKALHWRKREVEFMRAHCRTVPRVQEVYYSDLAGFTAGENGLDDLRSFLGIDQPLTTQHIRVRRIRPASKADKVENWDALRQQLEAMGAPMVIA